MKVDLDDNIVIMQKKRGGEPLGLCNYVHILVNQYMVISY
jgi:hypothetical protein